MTSPLETQEERWLGITLPKDEERFRTESGLPKEVMREIRAFEPGTIETLSGATKADGDGSDQRILWLEVTWKGLEDTPQDMLFRPGDIIWVDLINARLRREEPFRWGRGVLDHLGAKLQEEPLRKERDETLVELLGTDAESELEKLKARLEELRAWARSLEPDAWWTTPDENGEPSPAWLLGDAQKRLDDHGMKLFAQEEDIELLYEKMKEVRSQAEDYTDAAWKRLADSIDSAISKMGGYLSDRLDKQASTFLNRIQEIESRVLNMDSYFESRGNAQGDGLQKLDDRVKELEGRMTHLRAWLRNLDDANSKDHTEVEAILEHHRQEIHALGKPVDQKAQLRSAAMDIVRAIDLMTEKQEGGPER